VAPRQPALIFDLDGTLTDSKPGIVDCLRKVLEAHQITDYGDLSRFIGPPVETWTHELLPDGPEAARSELSRDYRACYDREGWSNNTVYPGVLEMLADLGQAGIPLFICTSKMEQFATRILDRFELSRFFKAAYGDKAEYPRHGKAGLLSQLMIEQRLDPDSAWMIGDRIYDVEAAHANNVRCMAAAWGYGNPLEFAQADAVASAPDDVVAYVLGQNRRAIS
jgi:phosphoglycolate phosphatase